MLQIDDLAVHAGLICDNDIKHAQQQQQKPLRLMVGHIIPKLENI